MLLQIFDYLFENCYIRPVVPGGAGDAMGTPPPYINQEGQIIPTTLLLAPPDFQTFFMALQLCIYCVLTEEEFLSEIFEAPQTCLSKDFFKVDI